MRRAWVVWFTGLSGSGKSTVAGRVCGLLRQQGRQVELLDGDAVRARLHRDLGFKPEEIRENNERIAALCESLRADCDVILVPIISPYRESRRLARERLSPGFSEVYCSADLGCVAARDVKGLYARARRGELSNLIGVSSGNPYEPPSSADLVLETSRESPEESAAKLHDYLIRCLDPGGRG